MAQAIKRLYPDTKLAIGPSIDTGFYYDFDHVPFSREDLDAIEKEMKKIIKNILQYAGALLLAIVIAALLRFFIVDFYSIPSDSMYPTIEPGDFIVVNKLYMGARFYKNFDFLEGARPETVRVPGYGSLERNDVIVFNFPKYNQHGEWEMDPQTFYVKRCIGLPGDTLSIREGINFVNGKSGYGNMQDQQRLHRYRGDYADGIYRAFPYYLTMKYKLCWYRQKQETKRHESASSIVICGWYLI